MQNVSFLRSTTGAILLLVMCVPSFVPALHEILHAHQHHHCQAVDGAAHFHADVFGCDLCDYLTSFSYYSGHTELLTVTLTALGEPATVNPDPVPHQWNAPCFLRGPPSAV